MAFNWNFFGVITLFIVMLGYLYNIIFVTHYGFVVCYIYSCFRSWFTSRFN